MILAKASVVDRKKIVAVCDSRLLGKRFEEKELQIDLTGEFYKGEEVEEEKLQLMLKDAYVADFVGEKSVDFAIRKGIVKKENVITISGVPRAQCFVI